MAGARRVRVLRVIARLNVGGPAQHVSILSGRLDPERYDTLLVAGRLGAGEGSFEALAQEHGARLQHIDGLRPELGPGADLRALRGLLDVIREFRPQIVHTHTAKAGTLGRTAARLALGRRPIVVHTYHGHVLAGYFGPRRTAAFRAVERGLATVTDRLIGVSQATVDDLVAMGIAPAGRFATIPVGLDLDDFLMATPGHGAEFRRTIGARPTDVLAIFVGRLAPIKRVDILLGAVAIARRQGVPLRLAIVGDGELRDALERQSAALGLTGSVSFCGFRADLAAIAAAGDFAVLSSDNEGTPLSLIEAGAAGRPAVSTRVGGVADIVRPETGILVPAGDAAALGSGLVRMAGDRLAREGMGAAARAHVRDRFGADRLLTRIDNLYQELLNDHPRRLRE